LFPDGFGSAGKAPSGDVQAIPAEAVLEIELELVSWKVVEEVTDDKKINKKILTPGEVNEKPMDGSIVKGIPCQFLTLYHQVYGQEIFILSSLFAIAVVVLVVSFCHWEKVTWSLIVYFLCSEICGQVGGWNNI